MKEKLHIFIINGSASDNSANQQLIDQLARLTEDCFTLTVFNGLKNLPHFDPELSTGNTPQVIVDLRNNIQNADGLIICTPQYVFSIPSGLKNAIEWCVSTTVFSDKPTGLVTASANGKRGHEELQLIMQTVLAKFTAETTLWIPGIRGKINRQGEITDAKMKDDLVRFTEAFKAFVGY